MTSGEQIKLSEIPVTELLPQRPPFVMIDCLTGFTETTTETRLTVTEDNRLGYASYVLHKPVRIGFIGAVRGCQIKRLPRVGETIQTRIEVKEEIFGLTLVDAAVRLEGESIAETQMKIALEKESDAQPEAHD